MKEIIEKYLKLKKEALEEMVKITEELGVDKAEKNDEYLEWQNKLIMYNDFLRDLKRETCKLNELFEKGIDEI